MLASRWSEEVTYNPRFPYPYTGAYSHAPLIFYWDTYFMNKGLLATGQDSIAIHNTLDILNVVKQYGYMGNAAGAEWGMNRSQPPFLSDMVLDIYKKEKDVRFIHYAYPLIKREYHFWTGTDIENHKAGNTGLQHYSSHASQPELIALYNEVAARFGLDTTISAEQKAKAGVAFAAEAASGMDFTPRFENRCQDFAAVDLNCLLYNIEKNMAYFVKEIGFKNEPGWEKLANQRKLAINKYCWDQKAGLYYDYNYVTGRKSKVAAITAFMPLFSGIASKEQAQKVINHIGIFETPYGVRTTIKGSGDQYQWGANSIWAPMQLITAVGLRNYGYERQAKTLARQYLDLVAKNYYAPQSSKSVSPFRREPGFSYEKYKTDGTINDDEYPASVMMGWTAGVYNYLYRFIGE